MQVAREGLEFLMGRLCLGTAFPKRRARPAQGSRLAPDLRGKFALRVLSHSLHTRFSMRKTAFVLVVLITGLVLLIEKTRDDREDDSTAQLYEAK